MWSRTSIATSPSSSSSMIWTWCFVLPSRSRCWWRARASPRAPRSKSAPTSQCAPSISARKYNARRNMAERATALQLDGVCAGYGDTVVLEDVRLALASGESLSVIGRNGVGKTTLLATIMGHPNLHGGRLPLHGNDISRMAIHRRVYAGLGYVPQEREIFPSLTVRENLEVAVRPGTWTLRAVFDLFPRLEERKENRGNQLSGGEQQ